MAAPQAGKVQVNVVLTEGVADWLAAVGDFSGLRVSQVIERMARYHAGVLPEGVDQAFETMLEIASDTVQFIEYDEQED